MNLADVNHASLSEQLGREVPEVMVVVAKHSVAGLGMDSLAELIGCPITELEELEQDSLYQEVRGIIGALAASTTADQGFTWDAIEDLASKRLFQRLQTERDPEFLLRAAATANKMTRRSGRNEMMPLEPGLAGKKVSIQLTRRMVERLTGDGTQTIEREERLSIHDGSMQNPSFDEVNALMGLTPAKVMAPSEAQLLADLGFEEAA